MKNLPILVMGLPGAGKTTFARVLAKRLGAVHWNADAVRANVNKDLGFSIEDRIEQARRMRWLCNTVLEHQSVPVIADFVCPTHATRQAFGQCFMIWMDRIEQSRFADTNQLWEDPDLYDIRFIASDDNVDNNVYNALNQIKEYTASLERAARKFHDSQHTI